MAGPAVSAPSSPQLSLWGMVPSCRLHRARCGRPSVHSPTQDTPHASHPVCPGCVYPQIQALQLNPQRSGVWRWAMGGPWARDPRTVSDLTKRDWAVPPSLPPCLLGTRWPAVDQEGAFAKHRISFWIVKDACLWSFVMAPGAETPRPQPVLPPPPRRGHSCSSFSLSVLSVPACKMRVLTPTVWPLGPRPHLGRRGVPLPFCPLRSA